MAKNAARTAFGPIAQVAMEQFVPTGQRLVHDPMAIQFLPGVLKLLLNLCRPRLVRHWLFALVEKKAPGIRGGILCRKRHIDEKLGAAWQNGIRQIVILGCGMDTRAYRIPELAAGRVYEIDLPETIAAKKPIVQRVLGALPAHVTFVPIDFDRQEPGSVLERHHYASDQPSFFIWEGVTQYITEAAVRRVLAFLSQAQPGSQLVFLYPQGCHHRPAALRPGYALPTNPGAQPALAVWPRPAGHWRAPGGLWLARDGTGWRGRIPGALPKACRPGAAGDGGRKNRVSRKNFVVKPSDTGERTPVYSPLTQCASNQAANAAWSGSLRATARVKASTSAWLADNR